MYLIILTHKIQIISNLGGLMEGEVLLASRVSKEARINGFVTANIFDMFDTEPRKSLDEYTQEEVRDFGIVEINTEHIVSLQKVEEGLFCI